MAFLLNLLEIARQRRRVLVAQFEARLQPSQPSRVFQYSQATGEAEKPIPLFGAEMGAFGEDWAFRRPSQVAAAGVRSNVPKVIHNRGGSTVNLEPVNTSQPYMDPATSRIFKRAEPSRQSPIIGRRSSGIVEPVLRVDKRPSFESAERPTKKSEPETPISKDPYSFY